MVYDKQTMNTKTKDSEQDFNKHFEEVTRRLSEEPNASPKVAEMHEQYRQMNDAYDARDKMRSLIEKASALKEVMVATPRRNRSSVSERLRSRPARAFLVFGVFWTAFVTYRTIDSHTVLGVDLERWHDADFLVNWLAPVVLAILFYGARWALTVRKSRPVKTPNPLAEFEREIAGWPYSQGKGALLLIKAIREDDTGETIGRLCKELSVEQLRKVVDTIKKMDSTAE